jgi:hypothetical protein
LKDLLKQKSFLRILFDTIPILTLVLDPDLKVHAVNEAAKKFLRSEEEKLLLYRWGQVIGCRHSTEHPLGCGFGPNCEKCIIRNTALAAIKGIVTVRSKGKLELLPGRDMNVLVSASCFKYKEQSFSVIMVEDISLVTELEGLIPICASCKRIRDDQGYWNRVEKYIEEHSEAEFTHDICPECTKMLYPGITHVPNPPPTFAAPEKLRSRATSRKDLNC